MPQIASDAFQAVLGVPLVSGRTVTGVLGLAFSEEGRVFLDDEVEQLSQFAEVASIALDNACTTPPSRSWSSGPRPRSSCGWPSASSGPWSSSCR